VAGDYEFLTDAKTKVDELERKVKRMEDTYKEVVALFGEDPDKTAPEEFFKVVSTFVAAFQVRTEAPRSCWRGLCPLTQSASHCYAGCASRGGCPQHAREENAKRAAEKALREKRQKELEVRRPGAVAPRPPRRAMLTCAVHFVAVGAGGATGEGGPAQGARRGRGHQRDPPR